MIIDQLVKTDVCQCNDTDSVQIFFVLGHEEEQRKSHAENSSMDNYAHPVKPRFDGN